MTVGVWLSWILVFVAWVAGCLGGFLVVRRRASPAALRQHHDIAGIIYAAVSVSYAVLLGFVAVVAWERHEVAEAHAAREAAALVDLYRTADALPAGSADAVRVALTEYVRAVLDNEWTALAHGRPAPEAESALAGVWHAYLAVEPTSAYERVWLAQALDRLGESGEERQLRLLGARRTIPVPLWIVLLVGAVITVAFSCLLAAPSGVLHGVMVVFLASVIGLVLLLVLAFQKPFTGPIRVDPTAFQETLAAFAEWDGNR